MQFTLTCHPGGLGPQRQAARGAWKRPAQPPCRGKPAIVMTDIIELKTGDIKSISRMFNKLRWPQSSDVLPYGTAHAETQAYADRGDSLLGQDRSGHFSRSEWVQEVDKGACRRRAGIIAYPTQSPSMHLNRSRMLVPSCGYQSVVYSISCPNSMAFCSTHICSACLHRLGCPGWHSGINARHVRARFHGSQCKQTPAHIKHRLALRLQTANVESCFATACHACVNCSVQPCQSVGWAGPGG